MARLVAELGSGRLGELAGGAVELLERLPDESVEGPSALTLDALLQLGVDVERHLRVGVPDLAHGPACRRSRDGLDARASPNAIKAPAREAARLTWNKLRMIRGDAVLRVQLTLNKLVS